MLVAYNNTAKVRNKQNDGEIDALFGRHRQDGLLIVACDLVLILSSHYKIIQATNRSDALVLECFNGEVQAKNNNNCGMNVVCEESCSFY